MSTEQLSKTPLHALHLELGARMVPFAGYDMPVQYPLGVMKEHQHTREQAGLFDVSHMGQIRLTGANAAGGNCMYNGMTLARDFVNSHGGINGRPIEFITYDDASTSEGAVKAVTRLIEQVVELKSIVFRHDAGIEVVVIELL